MWIDRITVMSAPGMKFDVQDVEAEKGVAPDLVRRASGCGPWPPNSGAYPAMFVPTVMAQKASWSRAAGRDR